MNLFRADRTKLTIFSRRGEFVNLLLPLVLFPILLLSVFYPFPNRLDGFWIELILGGVFFNTIHVAFSTVNLVQIPEMRAFAKSRSAHGLYFQYAKWAVVYIGLFLFAKTCLEQAFRVWSSSRWLFTPFLLAAVQEIFATPHFLHQSKGLSLAYNHQIRKECNLSSEEMVTTRANEEVEKYLFYILVLSCVSAKVVKYVTVSRAPFAAGVFFLVVNIVCVSLILVNSYYLPKSSKTNKMSYLGRILYWPFTCYSFFWGDFITRAIHGVEYVLVTENMIENSKSTRKVLLWSVLGVCGLAFLGLHHIEDVFHDRQLVIILTSITFATNIFHYYIDAIIFQFRDKSVRTLIGPLIQPHLETEPVEVQKCA